MLFLVCSVSWWFFAENSTKCCLFFSFGFFRRNGGCLFGFVLSLGFFNCIVFLKTSAFPNSHVGWFCSLDRDNGNIYAFRTFFSLLQQSFVENSDWFSFSDVSSYDFSLVLTELLFGCPFFFLVSSGVRVFVLLMYCLCLWYACSFPSTERVYDKHLFFFVFSVYWASTLLTG